MIEILSAPINGNTVLQCLVLWALAWKAQELWRRLPKNRGAR